ncbi:MAG: hypothetical protein O3A00_28410, partial [Planctomycetota bacterium]|nr:hypothetical protein [Planctomycetota bacterium]
MMQRDFPRLDSSQFEVTSSPDVGYNCVAWAAGDSERWWQPGKYWPGTSTGNEFGIATLEDAFKSLGYVECQDSSLEQGFEKVALYGS